jgi:hypothetical protein
MRHKIIEMTKSRKNLREKLQYMYIKNRLYALEFLKKKEYNGDWIYYGISYKNRQKSDVE